MPAGSSDHAREQPQHSRSKRAGTLARIVSLGFLTALAFLLVLWHGFLAWDDDVNFLENRDFRGLGWSNLQWAWTTFHLEVYQPLAWMALELQYLLCGLEPGGYHRTSLVWHAVNTILLYGLIVDLLERVIPDEAG
jgi:protein O-mannosyl-transferase